VESFIFPRQEIASYNKNANSPSRNNLIYADDAINGVAATAITYVSGRCFLALKRR